MKYLLKWRSWVIASAMIFFGDKYCPTTSTSCESYSAGKCYYDGDGWE